MSEAKAQQQEPTMEEILASIRRIISEDSEAKPNGSGQAAKPAAAPAAAPTLAAAPSPDPAPSPATASAERAAPADDVLELTDMVREDGTVVNVNATPEPARAPAESTAAPTQSAPAAAEPPPKDNRVPIDDLLVSPPTATRASAAFGNLSSAVSGSRALPMGNGAITVEEIVRDLLRPILKDWLDQNLATIVQRAVEREVARLADRADGEKRN